MVTGGNVSAAASPLESQTSTSVGLAAVLTANSACFLVLRGFLRYNLLERPLINFLVIAAIVSCGKSANEQNNKLLLQ
jgi:hypothetical protein